jgi:hypothetical protein
VAELALDNVERHALAGHLHRVCMAELVRANRRRTPALPASTRSSARTPVSD